MKPPVKIAVLCNNRMGIPAIQALLASGNLCGIAVPQQNQDVLPMLQDFARQAGVTFFTLSKQTLSAQLSEWITQTQADAVFMMTFPWRIPADVIQTFPNKLYNFHYGLLPEMRGADPVFESIRQQKKESGISVHRVDEGIDTGAVVFKHAVPLQPDITHGLLCTQLSYLGAQVVPVMLQLLQSGQELNASQTDESLARYYRKPALSEVCINWEVQTASDVHALVRACNPWNKGAYTQWNGWNMRIVNTSVVEAVTETASPGTVVLADAQQGIRIACKNNTQLNIDYIYTDEGFMPAHKLLAFGIKTHDRFSNF